MPRSNKTSQVMRLLASGTPVTSDNPALFPDGNSDTSEPVQSSEPPKPKRNRRRAITKNMKLKTEGFAPPSLKLPEGESQHQTYIKPAGEKQVVNVISMIINEQLGIALERFNVCACLKCCHEITQKVMSEVPPVFVHVSTLVDANEVNEKLNQYRSEVTRVLTKVVLAGRMTPYHLQ